MFINDILLFIKRNIKKVILVSLLVSVVYIGFQYIMSDNLPRNNEQELVTVEAGDTKPAFAEFYIENQDGTTFTNTSLIIEYFLLSGNVDELETETGIELTELIEADTISVEEEFITLYRNSGSNKFSFFVQLGNESDNLKVLNYYYNQVANNHIHFLEDRKFYPLVSPTLIEEDDSTEKPVTKDASLSIQDYLVNGVVGFVFGLIGSTILLLIYEILNNKMRYTFSYNRDEKDMFMVFNEKLTDESELENLVFHPVSTRKLIVIQRETEKINHLIKNNNQVEKGTEFKITHNISTVNPALGFDELIFVIEDLTTSQKWYKKQRKIASNYNAKIKVIHLTSK